MLPPDDHRALPDDHRAVDEPAGSAATSAAAVTETVLAGARITALHASHVVVVGSGQRVRIDGTGVACHDRSALRLAVALDGAVTTDDVLQGTLGRWAAAATALEVHEVVCAGDRFERVVYLRDGWGACATLINA